MSEPDVRIERLAAVDQYRECELLQAKVWGTGGRDVVPLHLLVTMQRNGGLVLGAFDSNSRMIGCLFGFLGARDGDMCRPTHCSHMMGLLEEWRGRGVGYRLKLAQREHVLAQGIDLVTWTYDPLESLNASLNIGKLGAICNRYFPDLYGRMDDELNAGLDSDRFQVEWWLRSEHVARRLEGQRGSASLDATRGKGGVLLNPAEVGQDGLLRPGPLRSRPEAATVLVEIPAQIRAIKAAEMGVARRWREQTRELFEACFAADYTVTGFISEQRDGGRRSYYVLETESEVGE